MSLEPVEKLASVLSRLPGVGRRSAQRMAQRIARRPEQLGADLAAALQDVRKRVAACSLCGSLTLADQNPCPLCTDSSRDDEQLCVVEDAGDIVLIEQAGAFKGRYHALMGKLSPMKGEGPENPRIELLARRVKEGGVKEVILALNADVESDATASYLCDMLAKTDVRVSRLAFGIPAGSGIAYSDSVTLSRAIQGRQSLTSD